MENIRFINWKSYFDDLQVEEYNLKESNNIKLYNTNDNNMPGYYQINYLNKYLGELVMMYYIWKHNLKSEYICISQYRKDFCHINFDKLNDGYIQVYGYWEDKLNIKKPIDRLFNNTDNIDPDNFWRNNFINYLKNQTIFNKTIVNNILNNTNAYEFVYIFVYAMKWDIYCKLCEFIFGFLDYVFPNNSWQNIDTLISLQQEKRKLIPNLPKENTIDNWHIMNDNRYIVFIIEQIIMICLSSLYKIYYNENDVYINKYILTSSDNYWDIAIFYKKNKKINYKCIYCKVNDENYDEVNNFFEKCWYAFPDIKIIHHNELLTNINYIELNINEYIDIDDTYLIKDMLIEDIKKYVKKIH